MLKRILRKIKSLLFKRKIEQKRQQDQLQFERCRPWFEVQGDTTLRLNYSLNSDAVVFDLGGYVGEFAEAIYTKYQPTIYVFEPVPAFYNKIVEKFASNTKVNVYNFGLAEQDKTLEIGLLDNSSSTFVASKNRQTVHLKSIVAFIKTNAISRVDLIKINIEGGEYDVLEALIAANLLHLFKDIQVQFHDFVIPNAKARMEEIQTALSKTHTLTYQYEFVWENWTLK